MPQLAASRELRPAGSASCSSFHSARSILWMLLGLFLVVSIVAISGRFSLLGDSAWYSVSPQAVSPTPDHLAASGNPDTAVVVPRSDPGKSGLRPGRECGIASIVDDGQRRAAYLSQLRTACKGVNTTHDADAPWRPSQRSNGFIVVERYKAIFALNPKVMTTFEKMVSLLASLSADPDHPDSNGTNPSPAEVQHLEAELGRLFGNDSRQAKTMLHLKHLNNDEYGAEEVDRMLSEFHKVLLVRNPFSRLYSAWKSKFAQTADECEKVLSTGAPCSYWDFQYWVRRSKAVLKALDLSAPVDAGDLEILRSITWEAFLEGVLSGRVPDVHWKLQAELTLPCEFQPTFIGSLEHSSSDLLALFKELDVKDPGILSLGPQNVAAHSSSVDYGALFTEETARRVVKHFARDFELFGYSTSPDCYAA